MDNTEESWIKQYWRPFIAWSYAIVCIADFIIFPALNYAVAYHSGTPVVPYDPITLKMSGFYHFAMMPIIGVSAWTRGMEKIKAMELSTDKDGGK